MKIKKVVGLPTIVSARHRIVIDKSFRKLFGIQENGTVLMQRSKNMLRINAPIETKELETKKISIGRFNLPTNWAVENKVHIGDTVYLIATTTGILVCPKITDFLYFEEVC